MTWLSRQCKFTDIGDQGVSGAFPAADVKFLVQVLDAVSARCHPTKNVSFQNGYFCPTPRKGGTYS